MQPSEFIKCGFGHQRVATILTQVREGVLEAVYLL